jgi:hypothetical protein
MPLGRALPFSHEDMRVGTDGRLRPISNTGTPTRAFTIQRGFFHFFRVSFYPSRVDHYPLFCRDNITVNVRGGVIGDTILASAAWITGSNELHREICTTAA